MRIKVILFKTNSKMFSHLRSFLLKQKKVQFWKLFFCKGLIYIGKVFCKTICKTVSDRTNTPCEDSPWPPWVTWHTVGLFLLCVNSQRQAKVRPHKQALFCRWQFRRAVLWQIFANVNVTLRIKEREKKVLKKGIRFRRKFFYWQKQLNWPFIIVGHK